MRLTASLLQSSFVGKLVLGPISRRGYRIYRRTDVTPPSAYSAMRKLFAADPSEFDRLVSQSLTEHPLLQGLDATEGLAAGEIDRAVDRLHEDGVVVLSKLLPEADCAELEAAARQCLCVLTPRPPGLPVRAHFDPTRPTAARYDIEEFDVVRLPAVQRLLADESLLALAQEYLSAAPVQDLVAMWWSAPVVGDPSAAAQLFHFDLDRLRFLKMFVYLTDVDDDGGPHMFVRGSHRDLPRQFRQDRRYTDSEVLAAFGGSVVSIGGGRGTIFLADTRGLHKGRPLNTGHRLVLQTEFASSLFGQTVDRVRLEHQSPKLKSMLDRYPYTFRRLAAG